MLYINVRLVGPISAPPKERMRRLMCGQDLQVPHRTGYAYGQTAQDGTITTEARDVTWRTDMRATVVEGAAFLFTAVDHCATARNGHAAKCGSLFEVLVFSTTSPPPSSRSRWRRPTAG